MSSSDKEKAEIREAIEKFIDEIDLKEVLDKYIEEMYWDELINQTMRPITELNKTYCRDIIKYYL